MLRREPGGLRLQTNPALSAKPSLSEGLREGRILECFDASQGARVSRRIHLLGHRARQTIAVRIPHGAQRVTLSTFSELVAWSRSSLASSRCNATFARIQSANEARSNLLASCGAAGSVRMATMDAAVRSAASLIAS